MKDKHLYSSCTFKVPHLPIVILRDELLHTVVPSKSFIRYLKNAEN